MTRQVLIALSREFHRLGMRDHAEQLASYYRSNQGHRAPYAWDDGHVLGWLKRLRIPPHERDLPVLPQGSRCPKCEPSVFGGRRTTTSFPGGAEFVCGACGAVWLELSAEQRPDGAVASVGADLVQSVRE